MSSADREPPPRVGAASTTVTGDATRAPAGTSSGQIVAADARGTPVAHTVVGLVREDDRYTLTVHVTDRDGTAVPADVTVQQLAEGADPVTAHAGDIVVQRGTDHAWANRGDTIARVAFVLVGGEFGPDVLGVLPEGARAELPRFDGEHGGPAPRVLLTRTAIDVAPVIPLA